MFLLPVPVVGGVGAVDRVPESQQGGVVAQVVQVVVVVVNG